MPARASRVATVPAGARSVLVLSLTTRNQPEVIDASEGGTFCVFALLVAALSFHPECCAPDLNSMYPSVSRASLEAAEGDGHLHKRYIANRSLWSSSTCPQATRSKSMLGAGPEKGPDVWKALCSCIDSIFSPEACRLQATMLVLLFLIFCGPTACSTLCCGPTAHV